MGCSETNHQHTTPSQLAKLIQIMHGRYVVYSYILRLVNLVKYVTALNIIEGDNIVLSCDQSRSTLEIVYRLQRT